MKRLIITNGDVAAERLRSAGMEDEILPWADMLHDGPVPDGLALGELSELRGRFLSDDLGFPLDDVRARFLKRDEMILRHREYDRVELWFEHDLFDQLQLIQVLDFLAKDGRAGGLLLVQADDYLGLQPPETMERLSLSAVPVTDLQTAHARTAWAAFTAATPQGLAELAVVHNSTLPHLAAAFRRLLEEFPAPATGLSLTEVRILEALHGGTSSVHALFKMVAEQDDARFLADTPFFRRLDGLAFGPSPLIEGLPFSSRQCASGPDGPDYRQYASSELMITRAGRSCLAGELDHAVTNRIDRWIGGVHLRAAKLWRWDRTARKLVRPD